MSSRVQYGGACERNTVGCRLPAKPPETELGAAACRDGTGVQAGAGETVQRRTRTAIAVHESFRNKDLKGESPDPDLGVRDIEGLR